MRVSPAFIWNYKRTPADRLAGMDCASVAIHATLWAMTIEGQNNQVCLLLLSWWIWSTSYGLVVGSGGVFAPPPNPRFLLSSDELSNVSSPNGWGSLCSQC